MDDFDDTLDSAILAATRRHGMEPWQALTHIAIGDRMHADARPDECGATSPTDDRDWCRLPDGHDGDHCGEPSPPGTCGVRRIPADPYTWCGLPEGHTGDHRPNRPA